MPIDRAATKSPLVKRFPFLKQVRFAPVTNKSLEKSAKVAKLPIGTHLREIVEAYLREKGLPVD